ncbi:MAG: BamA/TamA family outer membrane protein [Bacteroidetes bacterium]|nr:BamA/TamA family outer membrane protein [Bacteroidota bacterium]
MKYLFRAYWLLIFLAKGFLSFSQADSLITSLQKQDSLPETPDTALVMIADIAIHGDKKTRPYIIERDIPFKQGEYILMGDLRKKMALAQQQLMNSTLFNSVDVYIHTQLGELIFIGVDVKERWYLFPLPYFKLVDRNFNQWWVEQKASLNRVNYGIKFSQYNFTGRNDKLNIYLIGGYSRELYFKYEQPYANKALTSGFSLAFDIARQREINYNTLANKQQFYKQESFVLQDIKAEVAYLYRPAIKTRHLVRLSLNQNSVSDTVLKLNPNYFPEGATKITYPELSYTLVYNNTDYYPYPNSGYNADFTLLHRGINQKMNLTQFSFHSMLVKPLTPTVQVQWQLAGLLKLPFDQPYFNQQVFGYGDIFLRGLEYYVIDGVAGITGRTTLRKQVFAATIRTPPNLKRQISIPFKIMVKGFNDLGYAYGKNITNSLLNNKMLYTWGIGVDFVTTSYDLVFKLDYSFNQFGENGIFLHVRTDF